MPAKKTSPLNDKIDELTATLKAQKNTCCRPGSGGNAVYGLGIMGMIIYYFQNMPSSGDMVMTIFKIIFWPAFLLYRLLEISFF